MPRRVDTHPELPHPSVGAPTFSTWRLGTPERQRLAVDAFAAAWERRPWPARELRSHHVYLGHDGSTLLHHAQWASAAAYEGFAKTRRQETVDEIDTAVPGIERLPLHRYRHYRSQARAAGDGRVPGLVVTVRIDFEPGAADRRTDWIDTLLAATGGDPEGHRGLIAAHFHPSEDGTHVLNYAEWEDDAAYDAVIARAKERGAEDREWERVRTYPGVTGFTGARYRHVLGLVGD
ncbi:antibiotic biosynthesis monooxygenase [Streptomyces sp. NPDC048290]|uniref:antibiotic biosynthesis monooxygenase n=1 Tax=Streptomyces sp. NPDC048290 TaxID=3155811 RepID=UPI00341C5EF0